LIKIKLSKGKKDRFVKIPNSLISELKDYCKTDKSKILFPSSRGGKLTTAEERAKIFDWLEKLELELTKLPKEDIVIFLYMLGMFGHFPKNLA